MEISHFPLRLGILLGLTILVLGGVLIYPPFSQPLWYHDFADQRCFFCIPHTLNVLSNIPFVLVGVWGFWSVMGLPVGPEGAFTNSLEKQPYLVFFAGIALTGLGSAYYHSDPNNFTLVWDRLPLAVAFMALFTAVIGERISTKAGRILLVPLVVLGAGSVVYWHFTEVEGQGDLRIYLLVQFYPLLALPLLLLLFPPKYTASADLFGALTWYVGAKILEILDRAVYSQGQIISGHTLKHLLAAISAYLILHMLKRRKPLVSRCFDTVPD